MVYLGGIPFLTACRERKHQQVNLTVLLLRDLPCSAHAKSTLSAWPGRSGCVFVEENSPFGPVEPTKNREVLPLATGLLRKGRFRGDFPPLLEGGRRRRVAGSPFEASSTFAASLECWIAMGRGPGGLCGAGRGGFD